MKKQVLVMMCGRAGSKGFANKNLKIFDGHPLCYYSLAAAMLFQEQCSDVQVDFALNTDSVDLQKVVTAQYPEVVIVERFAHLAGDTASKFHVYQSTLAQMEQRTGKQYDYVIDLDITSPLRQAHDVAGAFAMKLARPDYDVLFSGTEGRRNPWFNQLKMVDDQVVRVVQSDFIARQQAPQVYDVNASIYVFERAFVARKDENLSLWDGKCGIYEMFDTGILDIDSEEDYLLMEAIARHLYKNYDSFAKVKQAIRE